METQNGGSDSGGPPPPSPLTGCYLLIVIGEPHSEEHKDIILRRVAKGLLSWDVSDCMVDLEKDLAIITEQALEGEEARYGERLIQYASENLVTEILIHPVVSTLSQCVRNLLSSFTRHRHIIHSGYTFAANGSWALQDGTFSLADFAEAFQELDVQRVLRVYENGISVDIHCAPEGDWARLPKEMYAKNCKVRLNPVDVLSSSSPAISDFLNYVAPFLVPLDITTALESSDVVGNIRFSHPTLYVFPGGQGDAALFGINGFNMLLDGGFSRKACFWDFVRHLDRLDAVLLTRLNNCNVSGITSVLRRKRQNAVYPQIGHFFSNIQERKALLSPDGDKDRDPLLINLLDEGHDIVANLRHLNLQPQSCYRDSEPINLYHKVGHGTLDMYVLSPNRDAREVRDFIQKWNGNDARLFANPKTKEFSFPLPNLVSICALLVWQPANASQNITRILFPGSTPQSKIFEGLDRLKQLDCIKYPVCSELMLNPPKKSKERVFEAVTPKILPDSKKEKEKEKSPRLNDVRVKDSKEPSPKVQDNRTTELTTEPDTKPSIKENISAVKSMKAAKQVERKLPAAPTTKTEKKPSPTTPKKSLANGDAVKPKAKVSPTSTPAKSAKEATNRKVLESKKQAPKKSVERKEVKEVEKKIERKPISRRPKPAAVPPPTVTKAAAAAAGSPIRKKPDSIAKKAKLDKEGTTDSSTVSTPTTDGDVRRDLSKMTPEELEQLKAQELADLQEEQEVVQEIEAVFRKGEAEHEVSESEMRKVKNISIEEKTDEEYLIVEDVLVQEDEILKLTRDSEESEKQRKLSEPKVEEEEVGKDIVSPEEKIDKVESATQPDEKFSATIESGATTAPTLPEDERIPLDEIKEKDDVMVIEEKHVKEDTKEEKEPIPVIQLPSKSIETPPMKAPPVVGIRIDKQQHVRDIVKTPDEVADLPMHEVADQYAEAADEQLLPVVKDTPASELKTTKAVVTDEPKVEEYVEVVEAKDDIEVVDKIDKVKVIDHADVLKGVEETAKLQSEEVVTATEEVTKEIIKGEEKEMLITEPITKVVDTVNETVKDIVENGTKGLEETVESVKEDALAIKSVVAADLEKVKESVDGKSAEDKVPLPTMLIEAGRETVTEVIDKVKEDADVMKASIINEGKDAKEALKDDIEEVKGTISEKIDDVKEIAQKSKVTVTETAKDIAQEAQESISKLVEDVTPHEQLMAVKDAATEKIKETKEIIEHTEEVIEDKIKETINDVKESSQEAIDTTVEAINDVSGQTKELVKDAEGRLQKIDIKEVIDESKDVICKEVQHTVENIKDKAETLTSEVSAEIKEATSTTEKFIADAKEGIETDIKEHIEIVDNKLDTLKEDLEVKLDDAKEKVTSQVSEVLNEGKTVLTEVKDDISANISKVTGDIEKDINAVIDDAKQSAIDIKESVENLEKDIKSSVKEQIDEISEKGDEMKETATKLGAEIKETASGIISAAKSDVDKTTEVISKGQDSIVGALSKSFGIVGEVAKEIKDKVETVVTSPKKSGETIEKADSPHEDKIEDVELSEVVQLKDSPDSPCPTPFEYVDKADLGRKSPKEREEDVAKIVASVAEVLKSEAPLEDFKGKIPLQIATEPTFTTFTTELRETHITTVDSPISELPGQITPIKEEKIDEVLKEMKDDIDANSNTSKISELMKSSNDLLEASSKIISGIKDRMEEELQDIEEEKDEAVDTGTVHRMLVTASSEDGGEETVICPPGSIKFPSNSESLDKSSPDLRSDELKQETPSSEDAATERHREPEISAKMLSEDIPEKKDKIDDDEVKKPHIEPVQQIDNKELETKQDEEKSVESEKELSEREKSEKSSPNEEKAISAPPQVAPPPHDLKDVDEKPSELPVISPSPSTDKSLPDKSQHSEIAAAESEKSTPERETIKRDSPEVKVVNNEQDLIDSGKASPETGTDNMSESVMKETEALVTSSALSTSSHEEDRKEAMTSAITAISQAPLSGNATPDIPGSREESPILCCRRDENKSMSSRESPDLLVDGLGSGKSTPEIINISGKSTPGLSSRSSPGAPKGTADTDTESKLIGRSPIVSGKASPEPSKVDVLSGKSTPDLGKGDSIKFDTDSLASGKGTPDVNVEFRGSPAARLSIQMDTDSLASGKEAAELKRDSLSGKTTPDNDKQSTQIEADSLASGKLTPDVSKSDLHSGKSTPEVCRRDSLLSDEKVSLSEPKTTEEHVLSNETPVSDVISSRKSSVQQVDDTKAELHIDEKILSGKSTPDAHKADELIHTQKIADVIPTPDLQKSDDKLSSGKSSPDLPAKDNAESITTVKEKSPEQPSNDKDQPLSGKLSPDAGKELEKKSSGKSTPDISGSKRSSIAVDEKQAIPSGKSTPGGLSGKVTLEPEVSSEKITEIVSDKMSKENSGQTAPQSPKVSDTNSSLTTTSFDVAQLQSAQVFRELMEEKITSSSSSSSPLEQTKGVNGDVIHAKLDTNVVEAVKDGISGKSTPDLAKDSRKSSVLSAADSDYRQFSITSENTKSLSVMSGKSSPDAKEDADKHQSVQAFIDAERYSEQESQSPSRVIEPSSGFHVTDPMSTSFYGALPDDGDDDDDENVHDPDPMSMSFVGHLPSDDKVEETVKSWGKPLGLPSPAPLADNKGTPKKERRLPTNVSIKNKLNQRSESPSKKKKMNAVYVDLTYVPHHGNSYYSQVDFFKRVRARYYVFSGIEPSKEVYNALLEAKQTWEDKELEVTIIPTYDTDVLGYWVAENEELLTKYKIDLSPSASRCTINLQDHETSCSAYRLEF